MKTYHVPFASTGNRIELVVADSAGKVEHTAEEKVEHTSQVYSTLQASKVKVTAEEIPSSIHIASRESDVHEVKGGEPAAVFMFDVARTAPVGVEQKLKFSVTSSSGEKWIKQIDLIVDAPDRFELEQNYPNPFNPTTEFRYQIADISHVRLKVFNLLGEEVITLVDEEKAPASYTVSWDASAQPSGIYFYRLEAVGTSKAKTSFTQIRKMALVK